jgi:pimeloyl-ACP methyl ester carboxylesterase
MTRAIGTFIVAALLLAHGPARADAPHCQALNVPVNLDGVPGAMIYGELCVPPGPRPETVQLLVHSTWYNLRSWDPPMPPLSYVRAAVEAKYATFNVDRFGTGRSTKPASELVTIARVEEALYQVVQGLRSGAIGGHAYGKVVWVGASFGSAYGWVHGGNRGAQAAEAYVFTGILHITKLSFLGIVQSITTNACVDPALIHLGLDCGYITNMFGTKDQIYYHLPNAWPGLVPYGVDDAVMRDVVSASLLFESIRDLGGIDLTPTAPPGPPHYEPMPTTGPKAYSNRITRPVLIVVGDKDKIFCGPPEGIDCSTPESVLAFEGPYFTSTTPTVHVMPDTGHEIALHTTAPAEYQRMLDWIDAHVGGHAPRSRRRRVRDGGSPTRAR